MDYEQQKIDFVNASTTLKLAEAYYVKELKVFVEVINSSDAKNVISDLIKLVKLSAPNEAFFSEVIVFKNNSRLVQLYLSYNKNVLFLNKHKNRITKTFATQLISKLP